MARIRPIPSNPLVPTISTSSRPQGAAPARPSSNSLYERLIRAAATSRDRDSFLREHQAELAQLNPQLRQVVVRSAGLGVPADTVAKALDPGSYLNRQIRIGVQTLEGIPGGIIETGKAAVGDIGSTIHGKPTIARSLKLGKESAKGMLESIEHPGRNLLGTALTASAAFTGGAGAIGRIGAVADVARGGAAANLTAAVGRLSKADARAYAVLHDHAKLAEIDAPTAARLRNPSPQLQDVLRHDPNMEVSHRHVVSQLHQFTPKAGGVGGVVREAGASKTARVMQAAIRTPRPKERTLVVPGPQGRPAIVTHPLPSKNPLVNVIERKLIDPKRQKKLDRRGLVGGTRGIVETPSWLTSADNVLAVQDALRAIDQVHASRAIPERTALFARDRLLGGSLGHAVGSHGRPIEIEFQRHQPGIHYVIPHEVGHAVRDTIPHGVDQAVIDAAKASQAMQHYHARPPGALRNYVTSDEEMFARAYAQYVAEKSGHPEIMRQLRDFDANQGTMNRPPWHWTTEDFKPISKAFDEMFEKVGWRTKGEPTKLRHEPSGRYSPHRVFSPEATVGRELRAQRHVEDALQLAGVSRLERFGTSKPAQLVHWAKGYVSQGSYDKPSLINRRRGVRLSAAEQKAIQIHSSNVSAGEHVEYHANKVAELKQYQANLEAHHDELLRNRQSVEAVVRERKALRKVIRHHQRQQGLSQLAGQHLANPSARLGEAIKETRQVILQREKALQISGREAANRVGKHAYEIESGARGVESPLVTVDRLQSQAKRLRTRLRHVTDPDEQQLIKDRIAALQTEIDDWRDKFTQRGLRAISQGGHYLPQQRLVKQRKLPGSGFIRRPGPMGYGPPKGLPEMHHPYRGLLQRSGNFRHDATGLAAESYRRAQSYATLFRAHQQLLKAAHTTREAAGPFAMPIREKYTIPQELREALLRADQGTLGPKEMAGISARQLEAVVKDLFPDLSESESGTIPGVKWIDGRLLGGARGSFDRSGPGLEAIDAINNIGRASLLYTKPAYALNLLQALGSNIVQQGVFAPVNLSRALTLGRDLGHEDQQIILSLVGQGLSRSFEADRGFAKGAIDVMGENWNAVIDRYPRVASLLHEMRREGFNTPEKIHALLHDERMRDKLVQVSRRANREAVEYGELTPWERSVAKRFLFFYPWLRGASLYTARFPMEHPIQAAVGYQLGAQGHERSTKAFGPFVDWAPGMAGEIPIGGKQGINLSTLNTPQTLTDFAHALYNPAELPRFFGPTAAAAYTGISGKTPLDVELPTNVNRYKGAIEQLSGLSPIYRLAFGSGGEYTGEKPGDQPMQPRNFGARLKRFSAGRAYPQDVNKPAVAAKGEQKFLEGLSKTERVRYRSDQEQAQARADAAELHKAGVIPSSKLPPVLQRALTLKAARALAVAQFAEKHHTAVDKVHKADVSDIIIKIVSDAKTAPRPVIAQFRHYISTLENPDDIAKANDQFWRIYGGSGLISEWSRLVNAQKRSLRNPASPATSSGKTRKPPSTTNGAHQPMLSPIETSR